MKKLLIIAAMAITTFCFAQSDSLKPVKGQFGFGLNLTGLIKNIGLSTFNDVNNHSSLWAKYYFGNRNVLRMGLGILGTSNKHTTSDSIGTALVETDSTYKRTDFAVSLGYERHFGDLKRLDPYLGAELSLGFVGRTKIKSETQSTDAVGTSTLQHIINQDGGTNFGLNIIVGFNYFVAKQLALGAEYDFGYSISSIGGDVTTSVIDNPASGGNTSTFTTGKEHQKDAGFSTSSQAAIILSYYF